MRGDPKSVADILDHTRLDRRRASGGSEHLISATINQIKATGRLIEEIKSLDKQNQRLAWANYALQWTAMIIGLIAVFFGTSQFLSDQFSIFGTPNLLFSLGADLLLAAFFLCITQED